MSDWCENGLVISKLAHLEQESERLRDLKRRDCVKSKQQVQVYIEQATNQFVTRESGMWFVFCKTLNTIRRYGLLSDLDYMSRFSKIMHHVSI